MVAPQTRKPARGEIWWVNFDPVAGRKQSGNRPALVLSIDRFQDLQDQLLIVAPMTRRIRSYEFHVMVTPSQTGLSSPGAILCDQIRSVSAERLLNTRPTGRLTRATLRQIEDRIRILFGLR